MHGSVDGDVGNQVPLAAEPTPRQVDGNSGGSRCQEQHDCQHLDVLLISLTSHLNFHVVVFYGDVFMSWDNQVLFVRSIYFSCQLRLVACRGGVK